MSLKFSFGEKILVKAQINRIKGDYNNPRPSARTWFRTEFPIPLEGIFLKYITLADGKIQVEYGEDGGVYFEAEKYIPGAWVCLKGRSPQKVFLSDVEINVENKQEGIK